MFVQPVICMHQFERPVFGVPGADEDEENP